jgi:DNA-binding NtrC family response regulator
MIAASKAMREVVELAWRCASTDLSILIQGEPDTGKALIAQEIHRRSQRAAGPFVRVACGALREPEVAAMLPNRRESGRNCLSQEVPALMEEASGGTLFLENVSQLPPWGQARLLHALLQRTDCRPVTDKAATDVRVIASTVTELSRAVAQQAFLPSLYYCLGVLRIDTPPLRHRPQDVYAIAEAHLQIANAMRCCKGSKAACRFNEDALQFMLEYDWPGNVAQLAGVVTRAVLLVDDEEIGRREIAEAIGEGSPRSGSSDTIAVPLAGGLKEIERAVIDAVIGRCRGNKAAAARILRLHRRTLYRMLEDAGPAKEGAKIPPLSLDSTLGNYMADLHSS